MFNDPLAFFLTFTTYGTWLHGNERGSFDRLGRFVGHEALWARYEEKSLLGDKVVFTQKQRKIVHGALASVCRFRQWRLWTLNVRTNHVHIVVTANNVRPERVLTDFKARGTRALRQAGEFHRDQKIWTSGGSKIYLFTESALNGAVQYATEGQNHKTASVDI